MEELHELVMIHLSHIYRRMRHYSTLSRAIVAAVLLAVCAPCAFAQGCAPNGANATYFQQLIATYALTSNTTYADFRDSVKITAITTASQAPLITKAPDCKSANTAYRTALGSALNASATNTVYVVRLGGCCTSNYVVWDPGYAYNPAQPAPVYMVFSSNWVLLSKIGG